MDSNLLRRTHTLICIDQESLNHLDRTELGIASFDAFPFVRVATSAEEARWTLQDEPQLTRVFVISSNEMPALNMAAAFKADNPGRKIFVVSDSTDPYFLQRCAYAQVDEVINSAFLVKQLMKPALVNPYSLPQVMPVAANASPAECHAVSVQDSAQDKQPYQAAVMPAAHEQADSGSALIIQNAIEPYTIQLHPRCTFIPVVSASGGVGKSTVSFLSAYIAARIGYKTLLMDFDTQLGDLAYFMGEEPQLTLPDVLADPESLQGLKPSSLGFGFVSTCKSLVEAEDVQNRLSEILASASAHYDVVIANCSTIWNDQLIILLERAAKIFFLLDQRPASLKTAQRAFDVCLNCGLATSPFVFLLNRCGKQAPMSTIDVGFALKGSAAWELHEAGREVAEYLMSGQVDYLRQDKNALYMDIEALLLDTLPQSDVLKGIQKNSQHTGLFSFLFKNRGAACL